MILSHDSLGRHPLQVLARMEIQTVSGIPDRWLSTYYGSGGSSSWADFDPSADEDGDGLSRLAEAAKGTNPTLDDTDGDGTLDHIDAWPHDPRLTELAAPSSFVVIPVADGAASYYVQIDNDGRVLYRLGPNGSQSTWHLWELAAGAAQEITAAAGYHVEMLRDGRMLWTNGGSNDYSWTATLFLRDAAGQVTSQTVTLDTGPTYPHYYNLGAFSHGHCGASPTNYEYGPAIFRVWTGGSGLVSNGDWRQLDSSITQEFTAEGFALHSTTYYRDEMNNETSAVSRSIQETGTPSSARGEHGTESVHPIVSMADRDLVFPPGEGVRYWASNHTVSTAAITKGSKTATFLDEYRVGMNGEFRHMSTLIDPTKWRHFSLSDINDAGIIVGTATEVLPDGTSGARKLVTLLPVEVISDLNNDGQITAADNPLRDAAMASGATDEIKDKGTEFIFHNDTLSNGIWDKEDTDPARPATEKDDDDAEEITIKPGITEGEVWLDHPGIAKLSFYKTRECNAADKVNLSPTNKFAVSASNPFPDKLFMRADVDGAPTYPEANPQFEGDLVLKIKVGTNGQEIEAVKMKLTVVKQLGAKKYFHAARDYIFENNSRLFVRDIKYSASTFRVCTICEELSTLSPIETYHDDPTPDPERKGPRGIIQAMTTNPHAEMTIITNGNMVYFSGGSSKWDALRLLYLGAETSMTDKCQGGIVTREHARLNPASTEAASAGGDAGELATTNAKYVAQNADGSFLFEKGHLPKNPLPVAALGGLATDYYHKERVGKDRQFVGYWPRTDNGVAKGCIFTATHTSGNTNVNDLVEDARTSEVPAFEGTRLKMFMLDSGDAAVALAHSNPDGKLKLADFQQANLLRLQVSYQAGVPYFPNTYLAFKTSKPRQ